MTDGRPPMVDGSTATGGRPPNPFEFCQVSRTDDLRRNHENDRDHQTLNTYYDDFGGVWRWRGFGGFGESTTTADTYKVGTLVLDLFDTKTKTLVWRGMSSDILSDKSDKNIKNLNRGVQKMFQHFPPDALKNS
jgi:hypothetical protein